MNCVLIADAGSTKTDWAVFSYEDNKPPFLFSTGGINAVVSENDYISNNFKELHEKLASNNLEVEKVWYYGAGCRDEKTNSRIKSLLQDHIFAKKIIVESDMLGAAHALFGEAEGIVGIMGTGSNSSFYDGKKITSQIPSLGFIIGDEGSGAALGKRLINSLYKKDLNDKLLIEFEDLFNLSLSEIIRRVYSETNPNRFLASLVPFIKHNINYDEIKQLAKIEFSSFFNHNICKYPDYQKYKLRLTGGVAENFKDVILEVGKEKGCDIDLVVQSPLPLLIQYHQKKVFS